MGAQLIRRNGAGTHKIRERRTLAALLCSVVFPLLLTYVLIALDFRPDLSEMRPRKPYFDAATALAGWPELDVRQASDAEAWASGIPVRMIGYMMDGYVPVRDGTPVCSFMLMPEAGQLLHPAHREPSHMVEVWLDRPAHFSYRKLVWVTGYLSRPGGRPKYGKPGWKMTDATLEAASDADIIRWFES